VRGVEVFVPSRTGQDRLMEVIYGEAGIKAGRAGAPEREVLR